MKILYTLGFFPPYVAREVEALRSAGNDVTVLLPRPESSQTSELWEEISGNQLQSASGISQVLKMELLTCSAKELLKPLLDSLRFFPLLVRSLLQSEFRYFLVAADTVNRLQPAQKPEVVHAHFALDSAHIARIMASIIGVPYTLTTHATDIFVPRNTKRLLRLLRDAAVVFTISEYNIKFMQEHGMHASKLVLMKLGLDPAGLPHRKSPRIPPTVVCIASGLVPKKGIPVLVRAAELLKQRLCRCTITVIGSDPDGTRLAELRKTTEELPIVFPGVLSSAETLETLSHASVFVLPSVEAPNGDKDGIPVALMEAMGMGIPSISTDISGIPELIENQVSGILVKAGSAEQLADAIQLLLSDTGLAEKMGKTGKQKVESCHSIREQMLVLTKNFALLKAKRRVK